MKVTLEKDYRRCYTLEDLDHAKFIIAAEKEDDETAIGWAEYAVGESLRDDDRNSFEYCIEVLKASAITAKNCRAWNLYGEETGDMDVWIEATAKTSMGFVEIGAYLSDIWQTGSTPYRNHMYIQYYKRA